MYYLHDKESPTSERVVFTETRNMPVKDPEAATKWMAYTAMNADRLKSEAGVKMTGRKAEKGAVYTYSLSWSPEENPERAEMVKAADETLDKLGLADHQALYVAHNDTDHPHIHIIANLVNPNDGRTHDADRMAKRKLSAWALEYEKENGIYCQQRVENAERLEQGEKNVRYKEEKHERKELIQSLYAQSDSGKAFKAALKEEGYTLAQGNRRKYVLVDREGKVHSLSRQMAGFWEKGENGDWKSDMAQKLSDLKELPTIEKAREASTAELYYDRDKQNAEQEDRIIDAAIAAAKEKAHDEKKAPATEETGPDAHPVHDLSRLVWFDRLRAWESTEQRKRYELEETLKNTYDRKADEERLAEIAALLEKQKGLWGWVTSQRQKLAEEKEALEKNIASTDMRMAEARQKLEKELKEERRKRFPEDFANKQEERDSRKASQNTAHPGFSEHAKDRPIGNERNPIGADGPDLGP